MPAQRALIAHSVIATFDDFFQELKLQTSKEAGSARVSLVSLIQSPHCRRLRAEYAWNENMRKQAVC